MTNPFAAMPTATQPPAPAPTSNPFGGNTNVPLAQPTAPVSGTFPLGGQTIPAPAQPDPWASSDPFGGPAPQRPRGPRLQEMYGRLLLITPKLVERVPNRKSETPGAMQDRMTADVVILDGGLVNYGGRPEARPPVPHNTVGEVPLRTADMFISSVGLVSQCRDALAKRQRGEPGAMVLGRLNVGAAKSADYSPPYLLDGPNDADKDLARRYLASVADQMFS